MSIPLSLCLNIPVSVSIFLSAVLSVFLERFALNILKPCLHQNKNCAKLVGFKNAKYFFCYLKPTSLTKFLPKCKHAMGNESGSNLGWSDKTIDIKR